MNNQTKRRGLDEKELAEVFRRRGVPLTVQRRTIYEAFRARRDHPTADQVYGAVKGRLPGMSRMTVYRVLDAFVRLGVARKAGHTGAAARFDPETRPHHHLVCAGCDSVMDLDDFSAKFSLPDVRRTGFRIAGYSVHFSGLCAGCARNKKRGR